MFWSLRHKSIPVFAVFVLAVSAVAGGTGVICVGDDGRIVLEAVCLPCCDDAEKVCVLTSPDNDDHEHDDCVNCSDLPFDGPTWLQQSRSSRDQLARTAFLNPIDHAPSMLFATMEKPSQTGRGPTPALASATRLLFSTILIC